MSTSDYAFADRAHEQRRLASQAEEFEPLTERLFRAAGLVPGMRVLDLGSGAGDVAILAARLVAREGEVVGVERVRPRWHHSTLCSRSALAAARNAPQPPAGGEYGAKTGGSEASSSVMVETFQTKNLMVAPRTRDRVTKLIPFPANGRRTLRRKEPPAPPRSG
jgi:SAM-dependent methyltransferase